MKYYEIRYSKKSHGDRPCPTAITVFYAKDDADRERQVREIAMGCEDVSVRQISQARYESYYNDKKARV